MGLPRAKECTTLGALRADQQRHIAEVLKDYRERLESARKDLSPDLDERGIPVHPIGARLLAVEARMLDVEKTLLADLEAIEARPKTLERLRDLTRPHLGRLRHHPPRPLLVPSRYFAID